MLDDATSGHAAPNGAQRAKAAARDLLDSTLPLMRAPPVNLGIICDWLGVEVYAMRCEAFGAVFSRSPREDRKYLVANDKLPLGRFRFSIAHELGHILLGHAPLKHVFEQRKPDVERQADSFAAELLLPEELLRKDCADYTMPELAARYKVSRQSLEFKLSDLRLTPKSI